MANRITITESNLWVILHQLRDLLTECEESVFSKTNITVQQYDVLVAMVFINEVNNDPIIITDLVPILNRGLNSISAITDRMEKNGFIEKVWDLPDRRSARLIITPKGEQVLKDTAKPNAELIKRLFSAFSKTDQQTLLSLANLLRDKMKEELHIREVKADREILNRRKVTHFLNKLNGHLN